MDVDRDVSWIAYFVGNEGKCQPASLPIPSELEPSQISEFLGDIYHEAATPIRPEVRIIY